MLEVGADAGLGEASPDNVLCDTGGGLAPGGGEGRDGGLRGDELVAGGLVLEEDDSAVAGLVGVLKLVLEEGLGLLGGDLAVGGPDGVPELPVLLANDEDGTRGLRVVCRGSELDGVLDEGGELGVGEGRLGGQVVVGAALLETSVFAVGG